METTNEKRQILSVVVPAFNEAKTIESILERIHKTNIDGIASIELIVVDDCSTDGTAAVVERYTSRSINNKVTLLRHVTNQGKGAAIRTGIANASGDFLIVQDADLEYDPNEYKLLIRPILEGHADVVYGSRFIGGHAHRVLFFWHTIGNKFLTFVSNAATNLNLTDMETCYKMFKTPIIKSIQLTENRFGFEPEITAKLSRIPNIRIYEVGISYYGRTYLEGKKIGWRDGFRALYCIIKYGFFKMN